MNSIEYAQELIRFNSTSHLSNANVSDYVTDVLQQIGCATERIEYTDVDGVHKISIMARFGEGKGGIAYFGHTDVVPSDDWSIEEHGPFEPTVRNGKLYGRGSTDMKGSIACMFAALETMKSQNLKNPVYISCTADEELNHRGADEIIKRSKLYRELVEGGARGIVGEATNLEVVYAHKGGCQVVVTSQGVAAHSSTREGINANMAMIPFLQDAKALIDETESDSKWRDDEFDPPTVCMNLGINDHNVAINITAPQSICTLLFRPMPNTDVSHLLKHLEESADRYGLKFLLRAGGPAFWRNPHSKFIEEAVVLTESKQPRTVAYGSEASNYTEIENLILLGPGNIAQAHKSDEWISLDQLQQCEHLYRQFLIKYCT